MKWFEGCNPYMHGPNRSSGDDLSTVAGHQRLHGVLIVAVSFATGIGVTLWILGSTPTLLHTMLYSLVYVGMGGATALHSPRSFVLSTLAINFGSYACVLAIQVPQGHSEAAMTILFLGLAVFHVQMSVLGFALAIGVRHAWKRWVSGPR